MKRGAEKIMILDMILLLLLVGVGLGHRKDSVRETLAQGDLISAKNDLQSHHQNSEEMKKICLTFDDGPHPFYTEQLLDGLKERGVKATFFVTGEHALLHPDIILRMSKEGHAIGNHTYSHMQLKSSNREEFKAELIKTNEVIEEIIDEDVVYVRPPYGS